MKRWTDYAPITFAEVVWMSHDQIERWVGKVSNQTLIAATETGEIRAIRTPGGMRRYRKEDVLAWFAAAPERLAAKRKKQLETWERKLAEGALDDQRRHVSYELGPPETCARKVFCAGLCGAHYQRQRSARRRELLVAQMEHSTAGTAVGVESDSV